VTAENLMAGKCSLTTNGEQMLVPGKEKPEF
jgi:hypothetical protein